MEVSVDARELEDALVESREVAVHPAEDGRQAETPPLELEDGPEMRTDKRFRTPDRIPATKRRGPEGAGPDPKHFCVDDSSDNSMPDDDGIDVDYLDEVIKEQKERDDTDKHIIATCILGVDITEVYSPERVNEVAKR